MLKNANEIGRWVQMIDHMLETHMKHLLGMCVLQNFNGEATASVCIYHPMAAMVTPKTPKTPKTL